MKMHKQTSLITLAILSAISVSGCNIKLTSDEETRNTINKSSTGVIEALGQLNVNGTVYDTSEASIITDGEQATESDLQLGMVVSVTGTENEDDTGKAQFIEYEDVLEGIVLANDYFINSRLNIMGQTVHIDDKTVFASNDVSMMNFNDIQVGNVVEVSGHTSGDGEIWATRVEVKNLIFVPGNEIEVKGNIFNLTDSTFNIGELTVYYDNTTFNKKLENNLYVEVSSQQGFNNFDEFIADNVKIMNNGSINVKHANND
jgi:hypothetical protein